jgi:heme oxygenase (mycobilin-producing)
MKESPMTVKIFIKRNVQEKNITELTMLLKRLRSLTLNQPGYISGETLRRIDNPNECMVISTWRSVEDWNNWVNNEKRLEIQTEVDKLLGQETEYAVYE